MNWRKWLRRSLLGGLVFGLALLWLVGSAMTRPTNAKVRQFTGQVQDVSIKSEPGIVLAGSYWSGSGANSPAILLLHGNGGNRNDVANTAQWLDAQGFRVLAIDMRGSGESSPAGKSFGLTEARDARAAFDWLKATNPNAKIGVIGFSLGGAAALLGDDGPLPGDALVLESVYPDIRTAIFNRIAAHAGTIPAYAIEPLLSLQSLPRFGVWPSRISPIDALRKVRSPVMIVGGGADIYTPPGETEAMFDAAHRHGELWLLDGLTHDEVVRSDNPTFRKHLYDFLVRQLGRPEAGEDSANYRSRGSNDANVTRLAT